MAWLISDCDSSSTGVEVASDTKFWILSATIYDRAQHVDINPLILYSLTISGNITYKSCGS